MYKLIRTRHTGESKKLNAASRSFYFTFHYIDNILSLNNSKLSDFLDPIYPIELEKKIPQIELGQLETFVKINRSVIYLNMFTGGAEYSKIIFTANHLTPTVDISKIFPQETRNSICLWLSHTTMLQNKLSCVRHNTTN
jgi:hypothetical protein